MTGRSDSEERTYRTLYFNGRNADRRENPWILMDLFVGSGVRLCAEGSLIGSFWSKEEALLVSACENEQVWATGPGFRPPGPEPSGRTLFPVGQDGDVCLSDGVDARLRCPWETE